MALSNRRALVVSVGCGLGGIEKSMICFLSYLLERGYKVDLLLWRPPGELYYRIPQGVNILIEDKSPRKLSQLSSLRDYIKYIFFRILLPINLSTKIFKPIESRYSLAVSYCHIGYSPYYVIDKVKADKKILFYHHGTYEKKWLSKWVDRRYYRRFHRVAAVSDACRRMLVGKFPSLSDKILAAGNLLDRNEIISESLHSADNFPSVSTETRVFVTVARLSPEKGHLFAIDVAEMLKAHGLDFIWIFIGDGNMRKCLQKIIDDKGLNGRCILLGGRSNPYPYIKLSDIYIMPSSVESSSLTIREAAILNRPVVSVALPAIKEAANEIEGIRLISRDKNKFAEVIMEMALDTRGLTDGSYNTGYKQGVNDRSLLLLDRLLDG